MGINKYYLQKVENMVIKKCFLNVEHHEELCCNGSGTTLANHTAIIHQRSCCKGLSEISADKLRNRVFIRVPPGEVMTLQQIVQAIDEADCNSHKSITFWKIINRSDINFLKERNFEVTETNGSVVVSWEKTAQSKTYKLVSTSLLDSLLEQLQNETNPLKGCDTTNVDSALNYLKFHHPNISFHSEPCSSVHFGKTTVAYIDIIWKRNESIVNSPTSLFNSLLKQLENGTNPLTGNITLLNIDDCLDFLIQRSPYVRFEGRLRGHAVFDISWEKLDPSNFSHLSDMKISLIEQLKNENKPLKGCTSKNIDSALKFLRGSYPKIKFVPKPSFATFGGDVSYVDIEWESPLTEIGDNSLFLKNLKISLQQQIKDESYPLKGCDSTNIDEALRFLRLSYPNMIFVSKTSFITTGGNPVYQVDIEWGLKESIFDLLEKQLSNGKNPLEGCTSYDINLAVNILKDNHPDLRFGPKSIIAGTSTRPAHYVIHWTRVERPKEPKEEKATTPSVAPPPLPKATKVYAEVLLQQLINKLKLSPLATPLLKFIPDEFILAVAPMIMGVPDETIATFKLALFKLIPPEYHPMVRIVWP